MRPAWPIALLVAACGSGTPATRDDSAGARLEAAATRAGLVADPADLTLVGAWARDTDRVCVVPGDGAAFRIGVRIDYGEGQACAARGTATRRRDRVRLDFGACRFDASVDGDRLSFPATVPAACDAACTGRASLAALTVDHVSTSPSEAATLRGTRGEVLCPG